MILFFNKHHHSPYLSDASLLTSSATPVCPCGAMSLKRGRKPKPVWQFYSQDAEKKHAICNACGIQRCKNIITLENHLTVCAKLSAEDMSKWRAIKLQRERDEDATGDESDEPPRKRRRRVTSCVHLYPCSRSVWRTLF